MESVLYVLRSCLLWMGLLLLPSSALAAMILDFEASPQSWVGRGQSFTVTPDDDYLFSSSVGFGNSLHFLVASLNSPFGPDWNPGSGEEYHYWNLDLSAPFGQPLTLGRYENTARWPFQAVNQPGLTFSGDHRGDNRDSGFFDVLEIAFSPSGNIERFAVNFTQYGEENLDWWLNGQLRYNSSIPLTSSVPEPSTLSLMLLGSLLALFWVRARRAKLFM